ncbi:4-hydroxy-tetrahydrodipicolinate reductase [Rhodococcus sp. SMB37]|uniref:NAD(P)H-dependent amine dehydrogenase family protein n=1 Tax=Rhodococcus sp. SMB37 TaxID=2512213 RepID=UPI00104BC55B|nr:dihydrodipicolinate reductase [Rhodococcus sp. SMB37]TCN53393.1 4-hydroxy-tetrahydrodipicolinate reductase [Rhodococcus sp. SMB37]
MRPVRVVVYGAGTMGLLATRMLKEKGAQIVGAIARSDAKKGVDLGTLAGVDKLGVLVDTDAERVLGSVRPDVVMLATQSFIPEIYDQLAMCIRSGANVLTLAEETFFPWNTSPTLTAQLDRLARIHGVTVTGGGHQDSFWIHQVGALMGASHRIDSVKGFATWNADDYGPDVIATKHVGETLEAFEHAVGQGDAPPTYGRNVLGALAQASSLTPVGWEATVRPVIVDQDRTSRSLGRTLSAGTVIGYSDVDTMRTAEGPVFTFEMAGYVYGAGESDTNEWNVYGEPDLYLGNGVVPSYTTTCTQWVNRVPDVINARPGVVTIDEMPPLSYRALPLHRYVDGGKLS